MAAAAKHLTPVLLEMGGKCPAIVLEDADPEVVVAELVASKMINSGQTCVAPDYLYIDRRFKPQIVSQLCTALNSRFGVAGSHGRIVSNAAYTRLEKSSPAATERLSGAEHRIRHSAFLAPLSWTMSAFTTAPCSRSYLVRSFPY